MRRTDLDPLITRWKRTTRALKIQDQRYGKYLTDILERRTDAELVLFSDPVEAALFFCLLDFLESVQAGEGFSRYPPPLQPGQVRLVQDRCGGQGQGAGGRFRGEKDLRGSKKMVQGKKPAGAVVDGCDAPAPGSNVCATGQYLF